MTIYYTAKDIEEMAAKGIQQIEIGPGITLTDFARETARQLNITLVRPGQQAAPAAAVTSTPAVPSAGRASKYSKPTGCMHSPAGVSQGPSPAPAPANPSAGGGNSNTVNRLIDLMGTVIKRGG